MDFYETGHIAAPPCCCVTLSIQLARRVTMKSYGIGSIRNVGLFGHQGSGKTSLAEALLYVSGEIDRLGRTDDGTAACDFDPEEQKRRISINVALAPCEWHDTKINIVDVPGYLDFQGEVKSALAAIEAAILVTPAQG